ncbi:hypothetical protein PTTG_30077, partial [Puccinia triticina 1-1 BBBD Race 1]
QAPIYTHLPTRYNSSTTSHATTTTHRHANAQYKPCIPDYEGAKFHCNRALVITTTLLPSQPYSTSPQLALFLLNHLPKKASNYQIKLDASCVPPPPLPLHSNKTGNADTGLCFQGRDADLPCARAQVVNDGAVLSPALSDPFPHPRRNLFSLPRCAIPTALSR